MEQNDSQVTRSTKDGTKRVAHAKTGQRVADVPGAHATNERDTTDTRTDPVHAGSGHLQLSILLALLVVLLCAGGMVAFFAIRSRAQAPVPQQVATEELAVSDTVAPSTEQEAEPVAPVEPVEARVMMIGDILLHMGVIESGYMDDGSLNYDHLFEHITNDVARADVAVLNQETILGGNNWAYSGYPAFNGPQEVGDAEASVGFDVILKATNHSFDVGYDGLKSELDFWASEHPEMKVIGAADPYDGDGISPAGGTSPAGAYIYEKGGLRIALLNYTSVLNSNVDVNHDSQVLGIMDEETIFSDIAAAREKSDFVVVFAHWGEEYETTPNDEERYWAGVFQDAGANVVIGGHPHVIQPVEILGEGDNRMLVCWSVGNFVSTQNDARNMVGGMVNLDIVKDENGTRLSRYEFVPTVTQKEPYSTNMSAYKLMDYTDELAAQSTVSSWAGEGDTLDWYLNFCADVLGDDFDWDARTVHGTM